MPLPRGVFSTTARLTLKNRFDHILARWAWRRLRHRVAPGLYALGNPSPASPVFVTANYTLSFDALRAALAGLDAWILVLDTRGINVWCAAGGKLFGGAELIGRIRLTGLADIVNHRRLILPQLSAPGVSVLEVLKEAGFTAEFGPVRAADIHEYLRLGRATPSMRRVTFTLAERIALIPVEMVHAAPYYLGAALVLYHLGGWPPVLAATAAIPLSIVLFPILLPWLPSREFSVKGFFMGTLLALPFIIWALAAAGPPWWHKAGLAFAAAASMISITAYLALNFTGATPFTSRTGVRREIMTYIPIMAWMLAAGLISGGLTWAADLMGGF